MKISPEKLAANQRNAQNSTGPKSEQGKRNSSMSALAHGFFSRDVVIQAGDGKENAQEFENLLQGLCDYWQPEGTQEELLVRDIAIQYWRLARLSRYEAGQIHHFADNAIHDVTVRRKTDFSLDFFKSRAGLEPAGVKLRESSLGINFLICLLQNYHDDLRNQGYFSKEDVILFRKFFGKDPETFGFEAGSLFWLFTIEEKEGEKPKPADNEEHRPQLLAMFKQEEEKLRAELAAVNKREEMSLQAHLLSLSMPNPLIMDKILRYGSSLQRGLHQTMDQLERLQRRRKGEAVPPPMKLNVSVDRPATDAGGTADSLMAEGDISATLQPVKEADDTTGTES